MAIKLVVLKSGEDLIADVKEIQSENSNLKKGQTLASKFYVHTRWI